VVGVRGVGDGRGGWEEKTQRRIPKGEGKRKKQKEIVQIQ